MEFLYFLESIRIPLLDSIMLAVTKLGEETAFLAMALIVFWCVDKKKGYYMMAVGFIGTLANQFLKLWFRIPRPWVLDENFTILEQAREAATGYSFPSGHSQSAVGTFGSVAAFSRNRVIKWVCVAICILVPLSRMYIGVHTPKDVLVGAGMAVAMVILLKKPVLRGSVRFMRMLLAAMIAMAVGFFLFVEFWPFPVDVDPHNLESGMKNAYTMLGCLTGVAVVYELERKYIHFTTKAVWWAQILKVIGGLGVVLAVKEGLRSPLELVLPQYPARAVRYFLIVLTAGVLWPMTFRLFSGLGEKK